MKHHKYHLHLSCTWEDGAVTGEDFDESEWETALLAYDNIVQSVTVKYICLWLHLCEVTQKAGSIVRNGDNESVVLAEWKRP
jgi:hypothetical protein